MFGNTWQKAVICLGIGCSFTYGLLLSNVPVVRKIEDQVNDSLILLRKSGKKTNEIALINISAEQALLKPSFYADLTERLLQEKAAVVVLNFPDNWKTKVEGGEDKIINLVDKYSNRIVLAIRSISLNQNKAPRLPIYNHFIPFKNDLKTAVEIENIQGFFEYVSYTKNPNLLLHPERKVKSVGEFIRSDTNKPIKLKSAAWLSWYKYNKFLNYQKQFIPSSPSGYINFIGKKGTFKTTNIEELCFVTTLSDRCEIPDDNQQIFQQFRHKIVLIGVTEQHDFLSVAGTRMSALEVQANLINSLMTNSLYTTIHNVLQLGIVLFGVVVVSKFIISGITKTGNWYHKWGMLPILGVMGGYGSLYLLCFYHGSIFPIALPMLIWLVTGISLTACLWIAQLLKQDELKQRQLAEKKAAVLQARKLLYRIASDIHDHPLQELKVVMDRIEIWQLDNPSLNTEPILEKLLQVNRDIRAQLNDIRIIANKLKITPELRSGLDIGIRSRLKELVNSGELTLKIIDNIQPLKEPELDSAWIDAREDIFRFFREAVANVIRHAQPPQGNATTVKVSLVQSGAECVLMLENDGSFAEGFVSKVHGGSYGTKIMETIATEIPGGKWERFTLADGGMVNKLVWKL
ncbi:CHASE2 domain-containing protein [Calothrix rhizosoleniae]|uniref:sensor histidine kinase n=1 Tax=Calothrix rhizosoleniae TaxID=888997 RepID=UPI0013567065|nr:CHASE2 domain-containing protein [Calothrix rhizosoleniae]